MEAGPLKKTFKQNYFNPLSVRKFLVNQLHANIIKQVKFAKIQCAQNYLKSRVKRKVKNVLDKIQLKLPNEFIKIESQTLKTYKIKND